MKRVVAILLCLMLLLAGCSTGNDPYVPTGDGLSDPTGPQTPQSPADDVKVLSLPYYKSLTLNPYTCTDYTNRALFSLLYQGLFSVDRNYKVEPLLCKSYTTSANKKDYTFYLEENATFSDGTPVTASDVMASLNAASQSDYYKGRFTHITALELSAGGGLTVHLDTVYENLPLLLDIPIVKASQVSKNRPLGSGPYVLYSATGGDSLQKRQDWWCSPTAMAVTADTIHLLSAQSPAHIRDEFEFSDLSIVCTNPGSDLYADYRGDREVWDCENGIFLYLATCVSSEVFANDAVRRALTHAIDRDFLVENFYRGFARSATLPASPLFPYYNANLAKQYSYDKDAFAKAVKDAALEGSTVVFLVNKDDSLRLRAARSIADMLEAGGLQVQMKEVAGSEFLSAVKGRNYDLYLGQTRLSPNMDLSEFFATYGTLSWGGVNDVAAYTLSLQALENHGNYITLHKTVMDNGLICPILFRSYAVYATRGVASRLNPARENVFYYSLGKSLEDAIISN